MTIDTLLSPLEVMLLQEEHQKGVEEGRIKGVEEGRQRGVAEGHQKGLAEAVKLGLDLRFGSEAEALVSRVERCSSISTLAAASGAIRKGLSLEEIKRLFEEP